MKKSFLTVDDRTILKGGQPRLFEDRIGEAESYLDAWGSGILETKVMFGNWKMSDVAEMELGRAATYVLFDEVMKRDTTNTSQKNKDSWFDLFLEKKPKTVEEAIDMLNKLYTEYDNRHVALELWTIEDWKRLEEENL